jgi:hypothetical protein
MVELAEAAAATRISRRVQQQCKIRESLQQQQRMEESRRKCAFGVMDGMN